MTIALLKKAKNNPDIIKNVRGINITPIVLKTAEKFTKDQIDDYYYHTNYYYRRQYEFRKKRSILTYQANVHNIIQRAKAMQNKIVTLRPFNIRPFCSV